MAGQTITHKAGDTFRRSLTIDVPGISAGMPAKAVFVRGPAKIEMESTVVSDGSGGLKTDFVESASVTADWMPGLYQGDFSFGTEAATVDSTVTNSLLVERGY